MSSHSGVTGPTSQFGFHEKLDGEGSGMDCKPAGVCGEGMYDGKDCKLAGVCGERMSVGKFGEPVDDGVHEAPDVAPEAVVSDEAGDCDSASDV